MCWAYYTPWCFPLRRTSSPTWWRQETARSGNQTHITSDNSTSSPCLEKKRSGSTDAVSMGRKSKKNRVSLMA